jgi:hypothetical protein
MQATPAARRMPTLEFDARTSAACGVHHIFRAMRSLSLSNEFSFRHTLRHTQRMPGRRLVPLTAALVALALYLLTLNPTFGFIDKGELVAAASTLGIAHPTGYPTIMMLGWVATKLLPVRPVLALNILSALLTAAGVGVLSLAFAEVLRRVGVESHSRRGPARTEGQPSKRAQKRGHIVIAPAGPAAPQRAVAGYESFYAALAALFVGLTATWWNQANGFEVYSLHALLVALVLHLFLRYVHRVIDPRGETTADEREARRLRILFPLALGLAFTNHLTVVLLAPAFLVYFFWTWTQRSQGDRSVGAVFSELARLAPWFALGLLPYLYLPLRASSDPLFNWGDPDSFGRLVDHVRGKQYAIWFLQGGDVFSQQSRYFFSKLPSEVAFIGLTIAALGFVQLFRRSLRLGILAVLVFVTCVIWAGGYDILEIEPYYMLAILALGLACAAGARWIEDRAGATAALGAMMLLVIATAAINFTRANERSNVVVEEMTQNMLATLPKDAVIISSQWDFWVSGSWYLQAVERVRPDIAVIDQELLRRSWYLDQMATWHPALMHSIAPQVERFRTQVLKFERDEPYDPAEIQGAYVGMIDALIDSAAAHRPVFVTGEVPPEMGRMYERIPSYLALRLSRDSSYVPQEFPRYRFHPWEGRIDHYAAKAYELYARSSFARALYEAQFGRSDLAKRYYEHAISFDPQWSDEDVPDQSLNSEDQTHATIDFFRQIRAAGAPK